MIKQKFLTGTDRGNRPVIDDFFIKGVMGQNKTGQTKLYVFK